MCTATGAAAQDTCELERARAEFEIGRFDVVLTQLDRCLEQRPPSTVRQQVFDLQARVHVARDDLAAAGVSVSELLRHAPEFRAQPQDPPRFRQIVDGRAAPARPASGPPRFRRPTRACSERPPPGHGSHGPRDLERRGYTNIEEVLHDLPGFDISRGNGVLYSNVYQRGYHADETNRTLFLVDRVEQNSLQANAAFISRQYPLSNIDRIEVVHGPASTMYGANAFAGVFHIITKDPTDLLPDAQRFGYEVDAKVGPWNTRSFDLNAAGRHFDGRFRWLVTARAFASDEPDLSDRPDWDFDSSAYGAGVDYREQMTLTGDDAEEFRAHIEDQGASPLCQSSADDCPYRFVGTDDAPVVEPTDAGVAAAKARDQDAVSTGPFRDRTENWFLRTKFELGDDFEAGLETWRRHEHILPWYTDQNRPGGPNTPDWTPRFTALFARLNRRLSPTLELELFGRFRAEQPRDRTPGHGIPELRQRQPDPLRSGGLP